MTTTPKPISDEQSQMFDRLSLWAAGQSDELDLSDVDDAVHLLHALIARIEAQQSSLASKDAEIEQLREALERLGSNEALTLAFMPDMTTLCGKELYARLDYARAALKQEVS